MKIKKSTLKRIIKEETRKLEVAEAVGRSYDIVQKPIWEGLIYDRY